VVSYFFEVELLVSWFQVTQKGTSWKRQRVEKQRQFFLMIKWTMF